MDGGPWGLLAQGIQDTVSIGYDLYKNWRNRKDAKEQQAYDREQDRITREREDNAVQRRALDLAKAGLSPHLAAGSSAEASHAISSKAPEMGGISGVHPAQAMQQALEAQQTQANIAQTKAQTTLLQAEAGTNKFNNDYMSAEIMYRNKLNTQADAQMSIIQHNLDYARKHGLPYGQSSNVIKAYDAITTIGKDLLDKNDPKYPDDKRVPGTILPGNPPRIVNPDGTVSRYYP